MASREVVLDLIQRSLGLRHKLKVHESMEQPQSHEELALSLYAKWELEDELRAIEEMLADARRDRVTLKRDHIEKVGVHIKREAPRAEQ